MSHSCPIPRQAFVALADAAPDRPGPRPPARCAPTRPRPSEPATARNGARSPAGRTVRVDSERLDALMHQMGELVIHRTAIEALTADAEVPGLHQAMQELTRTSQALQSMVMQVRMIPVEVVFMRFPRLVRDLGARLGKQVRLQLIGADTELDRTVVDALGDPLVHLVRNSAGPRPGERRGARREPASRPRAHWRSRPGTPEGTSSSRSATTAPASTRRRSPARP